jgi:hypothetical protein
MPQAANSKNSASLGPVGLRQQCSFFINTLPLFKEL